MMSPLQRRLAGWIAVLLITTVAQQARAEVVVIGANSCETWTKERAKGPDGAAWERPWLFAYISGLARATDVDFLKGADPQKMLAWVDTYCREKSGDNLGQAAEELARTLARALPPPPAAPQQPPAPGPAK